MSLIHLAGTPLASELGVSLDWGGEANHVGRFVVREIRPGFCEQARSIGLNLGLATRPVATSSES